MREEIAACDDGPAEEKQNQCTGEGDESESFCLVSRLYHCLHPTK